MSPMRELLRLLRRKSDFYSVDTRVIVYNISIIDRLKNSFSWHNFKYKGRATPVWWKEMLSDKPLMWPDLSRGFLVTRQFLIYCLVIFILLSYYSFEILYFSLLLPIFTGELNDFTILPRQLHRFLKHYVTELRLGLWDIIYAGNGHGPSCCFSSENFHIQATMWSCPFDNTLYENFPFLYRNMSRGCSSSSLQQIFSFAIR